MIRKMICAALAVMLLMSFFSLPVAAYSFELEPNTGYKPEYYPYVVHTGSADWYLAKADIDLMGLEAMCAGLEDTLRHQEADFADARAVLSGCLNGEVPAVMICTDFSDTAEVSKVASAYYNQRSRFIKVFHRWKDAQAALLHEYVHYLTLSCATVSSQHGFWTEGIAEYVSRIVCKNRMSRSVNTNLTEEETAFFRGKGAWDPQENCVDDSIRYIGLAELFRRGFALGQEYFAVSNTFIQRTEKVQQNPKPGDLSFFEAASMTEYLIETCGLDFVCAHWDSDPDHPEDLYGKTFHELYTDWAEWNTRKCADLGIVIE